MLFSETTGRPVVSAAEATTIGVVDGFVVDPATAAVVALRLKKTDGAGDTLVWEHVHAIGPDAVIVRSGATLGTPSGELAPLADKHRSLPGKRVLDERGEDFGTVSDVEFDPGTGTLLTIHTTTGDHPGRSVLGLGSYALVLREAGPIDR
ncbi:PRC-barrel domain-containing protein [Streptomyces sp. H10-C2]|uniref:PRC-barrel domain-containing protein n=1 Tax=unclassified Streptomyces TaxID=2593676 RepID=UPI0024B96220|nr:MULTISPECIES: PRC-barrel domain-containing protein [unclassified Streptomyces]MDJ0342312.1 PRC-barrel domain-containing protein [Streptomyces sp. PH10-H1]MDJ0372167.1 PRC-barrel domain-containing protein [Streptomyces sp. H10-C2]